jgi:outer membrane protein assembly factor BamB
MVFVGSDENRLYALNASTGAEIWKCTMVADIESSAAIGYNRVYVGSSAPDYRIYCLNEANGTLSWSFRTAGSIVSSPCLSDNKVLFGSDDGKLYCLNAITGNHLWNFSTGGRIRSSPAVAYGKVFFGSFDCKVYALNLNDGKVVWTYTSDGSVITSPSVVDNKVFVSSSNKILCLNAVNGHSLWNYTTGNLCYSSPAVAGGKVYAGSNDHKMYCLNAADGALLWNYTTGGQIYSSPAVADGKVYFGSFDFGVYCLSATSGMMVWGYNTGGNILTSSPAVTNRVVYVASSYDGFTGKLFAFGRIRNSLPLATNLEIMPSSPITTDNLIGSYDYYDQDEDPESGTEIRWYKNGLAQPVYNDVLFVPSSATAKGQQWCFTVRPNDGIDFGELQTSSSITIKNSPPSIGNVTITPNPAFTNDTLVATPMEWLDPDGDGEGYSFQWQKYEAGNWENISGATSKSLTGDNFVKEDSLRILCTPYDGESYGISVEAAITISNSLPTIDSYYPLINPAIFEGETQQFSITKSDIDLDTLTIKWYLNGTKVSEASDSFSYLSNFQSAGIYNITAVVSDGTGQTKHEWLFTVVDVNRDLAATAIDVSKTVVGQNYSLQIGVTVENHGDRPELSNVTIYAGTTVIGEISNVTLLDGNSAIVAFTWDTAGFAKGNYTISACVCALQGETNTSDNTLTGGFVFITIPADINGDHNVNFLDAIMLGMAFGSQPTSPNWNPNADLNCDYTINYLDTITLGVYFGKADP